MRYSRQVIIHTEAKPEVSKRIWFVAEDGQTHPTPRQILLKTLTEPECQMYENINAEHKYCTGQPNTLQDTCQVSPKLNSIRKFPAHSCWSSQGDSGGGQYCPKANGLYYVAG